MTIELKNLKSIISGTELIINDVRMIYQCNLDGCGGKKVFYDFGKCLVDIKIILNEIGEVETETRIIKSANGKKILSHF